MGEFTSGIFSGDGSSSTEEWGDSGLASGGVDVALRVMSSSGDAFRVTSSSLLTTISVSLKPCQSNLI